MPVRRIVLVEELASFFSMVVSDGSGTPDSEKVTIELTTVPAVIDPILVAIVQCPSLNPWHRIVRINAPVKCNAMVSPSYDSL